MSSPLRSRIGQLVIAGFGGRVDSGRVALAGRRRGARRHHPVRPQHRVAGAGCGTWRARRRPCRAICRPWVSVDQEGGRVARLGAAVHALAAQCARWGAAIRRWPPASAPRWPASCRAVGVTLDYAPVLDVDTNADNPVIGDRALSGEAAQVASLGAAVVVGRACRRAAWRPAASTSRATATRTPTRTPSLPVVFHAADRLPLAVELQPFRAGRGGGCRHDHDRARAVSRPRRQPARDPVAAHPRPAQGRGSRFDGLLLSDDLEMAAISGHHAAGEAAVRAVEGRLRHGAAVRRRHGSAGRRRRGADPRGGAGAAAPRARRGGPRTAGAREGPLPGRRPRLAPAAGGRVARAAGAGGACRRGPRKWRNRSSAGACAGPARCGAGIGSRSWRRRALSSGTSSRRGSRSCRRSGSSRSSTRACSRATGISRGRPRSARRRCARPGRTRPSPASSRCVGGYGSAQILPLLDLAEMRRSAKAAGRLQRPDRAALVPDDRLRDRRLPWADARQPGGARGGLRPALAAWTA